MLATFDSISVLIESAPNAAEAVPETVADAEEPKTVVYTVCEQDAVAPPDASQPKKGVVTPPPREGSN